VDFAEVLTLDAVLEGISIFAMKIDVEGFEARVFNGFRKHLETNPPKFILMEFSSRLQKNRDCSASFLWDFFKAAGYQAHPPKAIACNDFSQPALTLAKCFELHDVVLVHEQVRNDVLLCSHV
jgi:hypothetical protein